MHCGFSINFTFRPFCWRESGKQLKSKLISYCLRTSLILHIHNLVKSTVEDDTIFSVCQFSAGNPFEFGKQLFGTFSGALST